VVSNNSIVELMWLMTFSKERVYCANSRAERSSKSANACAEDSPAVRLPGVSGYWRFEVYAA